MTYAAKKNSNLSGRFIPFCILIIPIFRYYSFTDGGLGLEVILTALLAISSSFLIVKHENGHNEIKALRKVRNSFLFFVLWALMITIITSLYLNLDIFSNNSSKMWQHKVAQ